MQHRRYEQVDRPAKAAVTVTFWKRHGCARGTVKGPAKSIFGQPTMIETAYPRPLAAAEAFATGRQLASDLDKRLVVIDPDGVWRPAWGILYRQGSAKVEEPGLASWCNEGGR